MNKLQFGMIKNHTHDEELRARLQSEFNNYDLDNKKGHTIDQVLLRSMRLWVAKKVFFLIITFLFYGLYYFATHSDEHARNIFKAISETRKQIRSIKENPSEKNSETTTPKLKTFEYNDEQTDDELSYEGLAITYHFKKAHPRKTIFDRPLVFIYRFIGGNFLIQHQDLSTAIVDRCGNFIANVAQQNTSEITGITVNDDGSFEPTYKPISTESISVKLSDTIVLTVENATKPIIKMTNIASPELSTEVELDIHSMGIYQIAISHNKEYLATADRDGTIVLWKVDTFTPIRIMDTEIYDCVTLFVSNEQEVSVVCGEREGYDPKDPVHGRLLANEIRFYNRPVPKPETAKEKEECETDHTLLLQTI